MALLKACLELGRVSNLPSAICNTLAGWCLAGGAWSPSLFWLTIGAALAYLAGMTLNDAADAAWDRDHKPDRPIPSGRISCQMAWILGLTQLLSSFACFLLAGSSALWCFGLVGCILCYNFYHKPWSGSVWVMAGCRFFLYPIGASAHGTVPPIAWLGATALALYVAGVTLAARSEMRQLRPALTTKLLLISPSLISWGYSVFFKLSFFHYLASILQIASIGLILSQVQAKKLSLSAMIGWLLALLPLVDALVLVHSIPQAWAIVILPPLLRYFQRWISAT
jgi:UbiA prenyltransferase family